jgi:phosphopantothenate synthetase
MPLKLESSRGDVLQVDSDGKQIVVSVNGQATLLAADEALKLAMGLRVAVSVIRAVQSQTERHRLTRRLAD